jgi:serine/threonine protein kinase
MVQHQLLSNQPVRSFENLKNGEIFNSRWKILGLIGRGGFGAVYHALDLNIEGREVAIKILTIDVLHYPNVLTRFKKEVSITSKLKSTNTLMIYDFGIIGNSAYMVSELLIGDTLEKKLHYSLLPINESIQIIKDVAQVLEEAHDENIVHRDIKPGNIFLNQTKTGYHVKLIDFGIAKVNEARAQMTASQSFFGTPTYMSPEQITDTSKVDSRSDIYSLGLVLYHCIVGKPPFVSNDLYGLLKQQMEMDVPKIRFAQTEKNYEVINILIAKMTAKNPNQRFQKINQVIAMISNIQSSIPMIKLSTQSNSFEIPPQVGQTLAYTSFNFHQLNHQLNHQPSNHFNEDVRDTLIEKPKEFHQSQYQDTPIYDLNTIELNTFAKHNHPNYQAIELETLMINDSDEIDHQITEVKPKSKHYLWIILPMILFLFFLPFWYFSKTNTKNDQSLHKMKTIILKGHTNRPIKQEKEKISTRPQVNQVPNQDQVIHQDQIKNPKVKNPKVKNPKVKNQINKIDEIDLIDHNQPSSTFPKKITLKISPSKPQYFVGEKIKIEVYDEKSNLMSPNDLIIQSNGLGQINESTMKMIKNGNTTLSACLKEKKQICTQGFPLLVNELE